MAITRSFYTKVIIFALQIIPFNQNQNIMTIRVAKKILKNKETLTYTRQQVIIAEGVARRYEKNKKAEA